MHSGHAFGLAGMTGIKSTRETFKLMQRLIQMINLPILTVIKTFSLSLDFLIHTKDNISVSVIRALAVSIIQ